MVGRHSLAERRLYEQWTQLLMASASVSTSAAKSTFCGYSVFNCLVLNRGWVVRLLFGFVSSLYLKQSVIVRWSQDHCQIIKRCHWISSGHLIESWIDEVRNQRRLTISQQGPDYRINCSRTKSEHENERKEPSRCSVAVPFWANSPCTDSCIIARFPRDSWPPRGPTVTSQRIEFTTKSLQL